MPTKRVHPPMYVWSFEDTQKWYTDHAERHLAYDNTVLAWQFFRQDPGWTRYDDQSGRVCHFMVKSARLYHMEELSRMYTSVFPLGMYMMPSYKRNVFIVVTPRPDDQQRFIAGNHLTFPLNTMPHPQPSRVNFHETLYVPHEDPENADGKLGWVGHVYSHFRNTCIMPRAGYEEVFFPHLQKYAPTKRRAVMDVLRFPTWPHPKKKRSAKFRGGTPSVTVNECESERSIGMTPEDQEEWRESLNDILAFCIRTAQGWDTTVYLHYEDMTRAFIFTSTHAPTAESVLHAWRERR